MAGKQYVTNPNTPFFSVEEDDVDDETFLRHSKSGSSGYMLPNNSYLQGNNALEDNRLQLLERKKAIEERTLQSSERSISLLRDSEQIGVATAEVCCCFGFGLASTDYSPWFFQVLTTYELTFGN
jgi:synaptosomal-associated protein 29